MAQTVEESIINHILMVVVPYDGKQSHIATIAQKAFSSTLKSVVENGVFVLYKKKETGWERLPHNDLILNEMRTTIVRWFDKARYTVKSPNVSDQYTNQFQKWHMLLLNLMNIQERLYDYTFMKGVLEEAILLLYVPE